MIQGLFLSLRVTSAFLLLFLWMFLPHRYNKIITLCMLLSSYWVTGFLEVVISDHVAQSIDLPGIAVLMLEVVTVLGTAILVGEHRDSRAIFVGLSACTFSIAALMVGSLLYFYQRSLFVSLPGQTAFSILVLSVLYLCNYVTPLTELLVNKEGRWQLCFVPLLCFAAIFISGIWPGNIFLIPACRPITMIMILLMFIFCYLVVVLLRTQSRAKWVSGNNELLEAYASSLKKQLEQLGKSQEEISILRHDIRHRGNMVLYYLDTENTEAIRKMIAVTDERLQETVIKRCCADEAINWVLLQTSERAAEKGVRFQSAADIAPLPPSLEFELGVVVLNLLENAIRAACAVPEEDKRFVRFTARPVKDQLFLETENSYAGELRFSSETGLPLSSGGEGHGLGLRSVLAFSKKHGASFDCQAYEGVFHARLLIPLGEN